MLGRVAVLTAAYGYWLATAGEDEAYWLAQEMSSRFGARLSSWTQKAIGDGMSSDTLFDLARVWAGHLRQTGFIYDRHLAALTSLARLSPEIQPFLGEFAGYAAASLINQKNRVRSAFARRSAVSDLEELAGLEKAHEPWREEAARLVPRRLFRGPLSARAHLPKLSAEDRLSWYRLADRAGGGWRTQRWLAEYWCDGQRTLREIAELIELESGHSPGPELLECFQLLAKMDLVELREVNGAPA
jgi:hypothetical protein